MSNLFLKLKYIYRKIEKEIETETKGEKKKDRS